MASTVPTNRAGDREARDTHRGTAARRGNAKGYLAGRGAPADQPAFQRLATSTGPGEIG